MENTNNKKVNEVIEYFSLFTSKTANEWIELAKTKPIPNMLCSEFWYEQELCILFADTNLGKSILAVQIANSISKGEAIKGFKNEAPAQIVLYFDYELSYKQFQNRYSNNFQEEYVFSKNFIRVEIDPDSEIPKNLTFEQYLSICTEQKIKEHEAKVLIIDNITFLKTDTEKAIGALSLMKELKALKNKYGLSLLVLAHTPKRDLTKLITRNDLQGSKMLINFCDSAFTIGESNSNKSIRYIKQIKSRNTEIIYDTQNVCVCRIDKPFNFLMFQFVDYGSESIHLKQLTELNKTERLNEILDLRKDGLTFQAIGDKFGLSEGAIRKIINGK